LSYAGFLRMIVEIWPECLMLNKVSVIHCFFVSYSKLLF